MPAIQHNESWFVALGEYCTRLAANAFVQLTSCVRLPDEYSTADLAAYHASLNGFGEENRDSMGLLAASFTGRESRVRELIALPWTNINAQYGNGNTPLILAVQGQNETLVRLLLDHPAINVNLRGLDGYTALIRACSFERADIVAMILARGDTNVNMATYYGTTALTNAIRSNNDDAVQLLLMRKDIDINMQSRHGENALLEAVGYQRHEVARALINRPDIEVDVLDARDRSPLIIAAQFGYTRLVRLLLFAGADPSAEDDQGQTALQHALRRGAVEIVHDLLEVLSQPQSLIRQCRTVIRRTMRQCLGPGQRLKHVIDRMPKDQVPKRVRKFLAYEV